MQNLELKFQGSPQKFGKAAYCDLIYTESKLYDHILYKDLISFKEVWNFKSDVLALTAINEHLEDKCSNIFLENNTIIQAQKEEINFLKEKNRLLTNKNIERTNKILKEHRKLIQNLIKEKEDEFLFVQSQKQLLEKRIQQLETELARNLAIITNIEKQRLQFSRREKQFQQSSLKNESKLKELEKAIQQISKQHKIQVKSLNDEKLDIELYFKKLMLQHTQTFKLQREDLEKFYTKKLQLKDEQKINASLASKENLNRVIKNYEHKLEQSRQKSSQLQELVEKLSKQFQSQKQKAASLENDVKKQDDILDKYEGYLKESDQNIIKLKELLLQSQQQLEKAKVSLEKAQIQRDSLQNRIKICEEEAKMWKESYYLSKSRDFYDN